MKDGPISKLTSIETRHRPSQFKKLIDALPVFCTDKNYGDLDEILRTGRDKVENDFIPAYPNANLWSTTHHTHSSCHRQSDGPPSRRHRIERASRQIPNGATDNRHEGKSAKKLLSEYERNPKNKSQEYSKFFQDKKSLITILFGQCDEATHTEIALGDNYTEDRGKRKAFSFY